MKNQTILLSVLIISLICGCYAEIPFDEQKFFSDIQEIKNLKLGMDINTFIAQYRSKEITDIVFKDQIELDLSNPEIKKEYENAPERKKKEIEKMIEMSQTFRAFKLLDLPEGYIEITVWFIKSKIEAIILYPKETYGSLSHKLHSLYGLPTKITSVPDLSAKSDPSKYEIITDDDGFTKWMKPYFPFYFEHNYWEDAEKGITLIFRTKALPDAEEKYELRFELQLTLIFRSGEFNRLFKSGDKWDSNDYD